ncbi:hypothetical protein NHQ30_003687 [Ciborinia camelliae]|nr:hypothetical protein NHQ30_003687 [Ciborinia camelliae]
MDSIVKPQAIQRKLKDGKESKIFSKSDEITAILEKYDSLDKPKNLVIIDDSDFDEAAATTQKRALTTRRSLNYEDIEPLKTISKAFDNNSIRQNSHQHLIYESFGSAEAQRPCTGIQQNFIDNIETIGGQIGGQLRLPISNHSRMNLQHISERDEENEGGREKGLQELIRDRHNSESSGSVRHIDDLEQEEINNIQKVSHVENIEVSDANHPKPIIQHINDFDDLDNHSATTEVDDAQEQGTPDPRKTPKKIQWYGKWQMRTFKIGYVRPSLPGGPKPVNRLGKTQNATTSTKPRPFEPINLHDSRPYKKQRTEQASPSNGTFGGPNRFEQGGSQDQRPVRQIPTQGQYNNSSYQETGPPQRDRYLGEYTVDEYQVVNQIVQPPKVNKHRRKVNRPLGSQDSSNGNHCFRAEQRENAKRIANSSHVEDSDDPINNEDELQAPLPAVKTTPQVVVPYSGNSNLSPARPFTSSRVHGPRKSSCFSKSQTSKQISPNSTAKRSILGELPLECGSEDELCQENAPKVSHGTQGNKSHGKTKLYDDDSDEGYEDERSLDKRGDIPQTNFSHRGTGIQTSRQQGKPNKYRVRRLFSQSRYWHLQTSSGACHLILDQYDGNVTLLNDAMVHDNGGFLIKPISIHSFKRDPESCKMIIGKSAGASPMQDSKIFIEFYTPELARTFFDSLSPSFTNLIGTGIVPETSLDQEFLQACKILDKRTAQEANKPSRAERQPEDVQLLALNQSRRTAQHPELEYDDQQPYNNGIPRPKRQKLHEQMQGPLMPKNIMKGSVDAIEAPEFYSSSSKTNEIRASLRSADKSNSHKTVPKERTPSPERWSQVNRGWVKDWDKSVVYPKTGKKTATVDKQDIYRLDDGEFLNDNLIMFYLLWLEQQHHKELSNRVYVHNTFFYASLTKTAKGKRGINYEAVERWTAKVDLLSYDYIIVPVNENTHWYVAIICNAPKLLDPETKELSQSVESGAKFEMDRGIESPDASKLTTPSKSPQLTPKRSASDMDEAEVGNSFRDLSLLNEEETETPLDIEPAESLPRGNHGLASVSSDVGSGKAAASKSATHVINLAQSSSPSGKPNSTAKGKKSPPTRTHDPKQPRIITLDSLALRHSSTCVNLKDYMVAEIKAKKGISITPPKALGMAAKTQAKDDDTGVYLGKGLPEQGNYCDCGVYLLSYLEEFFERPDGFIEDIMENKYEVRGDRNDTPAFRTKIREILFKLQAEQKRAAEAAKKAKLAKKWKDAPYMAADKVEPPTPQTASIPVSSSARPHFASDTSPLNASRNHSTSAGAARMTPKSLPNPQTEEVIISIEDSQDNLQEQLEEEFASCRAKDVEKRANTHPKSRGRDREPRQTTQTAVKSGPPEPSIHFEIVDSSEDQQSTQESANHQSLAQQQPKRKHAVIELDRDGVGGSNIIKDYCGPDFQDTTNGFGKVVGKLINNLFPASKGEGSGLKPTSEPRGQDDIQPLESPSHSGMNSPPPLENNVRSKQRSQDLCSSSSELDNSKVSRSKKTSFNNDDHVDLVSSAKRRKGNKSRVDLTEDDPDEMLLDQDNLAFPDVQQIPSSPSPLLARQDVKSRKEDGDKSRERFRHNGVEGFVNQPLSGRDPAEAKMIAQSKH